MRAQYRGRLFQLWRYQVSHGCLLIRSPKDADHPRNVDIVFAGVDYVELPRLLPDLEIAEPTEADVLRAEELLGRAVRRESVVAILARGRRHIVVSAAVRVEDNEMELFEVPFD